MRNAYGKIYFIQAQCGSIKIGYSYNPLQRLETIQSHNPGKIILLAVMCGDYSLEKAIHKKFAKSCIHNEWFTPTPELMDYIAKNAAIPDELGCVSNILTEDKVVRKKEETIRKRMNTRSQFKFMRRRV